MSELRRLRTAAGLTLEEVAAAADIHLAHLSRAERNERGLSAGAEWRVRAALTNLLARRAADASRARGDDGGHAVNPRRYVAGEVRCMEARVREAVSTYSESRVKLEAMRLLHEQAVRALSEANTARARLALARVDRLFASTMSNWTPDRERRLQPRVLRILLAAVRQLLRRGVHLLDRVALRILRRLKRKLRRTVRPSVSLVSSVGINPHVRDPLAHHIAANAPPAQVHI